MQSASARLDVALPLHTEHFGKVTLTSAVESFQHFTHEGVGLVVVGLTMLSSTCVATRIVSPSLSFLLHIAPSYPAF